MHLLYDVCNMHRFQEDHFKQIFTLPCWTSECSLQNPSWSKGFPDWYFQLGQHGALRKIACLQKKRLVSPRQKSYLLHILNVLFFHGDPSMVIGFQCQVMVLWKVGAPRGPKCPVLETALPSFSTAWLSSSFLAQSWNEVTGGRDSWEILGCSGRSVSLYRVWLI